MSAVLENPIELESKFGDFLIDRGLLDNSAVDRARRLSGEGGDPLHVLLPKLGLISERDLAEALAEHLSLPFVSASEFPDVAILEEKLSPRFLRESRVLPMSLGAEGLVLAMANPLDEYARDALRLTSGCELLLCIAEPSEIEAAVERLYGQGSAGSGQVEEVGEGGDEGLDLDVERLKDLASEAPVIRMVNALIDRAVESRASDIHIEAFETRTRVRYRIDGVLQEVDPPPNRFRAALVSRIKIMAKLNIAERRLPQDGRIKLAIRGIPIDLRVSTVPTMHGEGVVLRVLDRQGVKLDFGALGVAGKNLETYLEILAQPHGIFLVTGPTGSGKTTTLYAALAQLNRPDKKIITVEDPVEYQIDGITQVQVKPQIGLEFASVIRAILRNNPNIVMIGEIRDSETAAVAVQAALTGHLVLATLHTNSAAAAINRLRDMGVEDYLITATVIGVMAQRLVRTLCETCKAPEDASAVAQILDKPGDGFCVPVGCSTCGHTGFRGRTGVHEVLAVDSDIRSATLDRADEREIERLARGAGMIPMREDGIAKAAAGQVALSEVLLAASLQAD